MSTRVTLGPVGTGGPIGPAGAAGAPGAPGATGPQGPPGVGNWKGVWSNATAYAFQDEVQGSDGLYYFAVQANTGHNPTTDSSHTYWVPTMSTVVLTASSTPAQAPGVQWAVNVKDGKYGAKGDGSTDDTAAALAAQADARAKGCALYFPTGTYKLTSSFTIQAGDEWRGDRWSAGGGGSQLNFAFSSPGDVFTGGVTTGFTDTASFEDLFIHGDSVNTQRGFFLKTVRYFKWRRVWMNGMTRESLYLYGQRNALGQIDGSHPGDCTHNTAEHCVFISADTTGTYDAVRLGGTAINAATTITADGGTTITVGNGTQVFGSAGTIICSDNGEQINFNGKTGNVLTVTARGVNGTTQITHPNGTTFYVKRAMGASNMNSLRQCVMTSTSSLNRHGLYIEAGANNNITEASSMVGVGADGAYVEWYSNAFVGTVNENNGRHGVHFGGNYDAHDNYALAQDCGGLNTLSDVLDESDGNGWLMPYAGLKLGNNYYSTTDLVAGTMYRLPTDSLLHYKDASGNAHSIGFTSRRQTQETARKLLTEPYNVLFATSSVQPTAGTIYCTLSALEIGDVVTNLVVLLTITGAGIAPTLMKLALVSKAGVVLATTGDTSGNTNWTTGGTGQIPFALTSPYTIPSTDGYYIAFLQVGNFGTTQPKLGQIASLSAAGGSLGGTGARMFALGGTSQTDITGTLTLAAPGTSGAYWLASN